MLVSIPLNMQPSKSSLQSQKKKISHHPPLQRLSLFLYVLSGNDSNINLAAGLIAASWQCAQTQSVVDGGEYREKRERGEKN